MREPQDRGCGGAQPQQHRANGEPALVRSRDLRTRFDIESLSAAALHFVTVLKSLSQTQPRETRCFPTLPPDRGCGEAQPPHVHRAKNEISALAATALSVFRLQISNFPLSILNPGVFLPLALFALVMLATATIHASPSLPNAPAQAFPAHLSEIGLFADTAKMEPGPAMLHYELNVPFWSDGANKTRWIVIPEDKSKRIRFNPTSEWSF